MADEELPAHGKTPDGPRDTAVEFTKVLAWPVLTVVLLICFWSPLHTLVNILPQLLSETEEFSIGGASAHLRKSFVDQAPPDLKEILANLGPEEVRLILQVRPDDVVCYPDPPPPEQQRPYAALVRLNVFAWVTKDQAEQQKSAGYPCGYGVSTTLKFGRIRDLLIDAISEAIQQSRTLPESKSKTIKGSELKPNEVPGARQDR